MGRLDEMPGGGRYMVGGQLVDANGKAAEDAPAQGGGFDVEGATLDELKSEAERRGIEVKRGDGGDGAPRKADFQAALR